MTHTEDPFAPNPEDTPTKEPRATEVEAERVDSGNAAKGETYRYPWIYRVVD